MKNLLLVFTFFLGLSSFSMDLKLSEQSKHDSLYQVFEYLELSELQKPIYISKGAELRILFSDVDSNFRIVLDNDTTSLYSDAPVVLSELKRGDHSLLLYHESDTSVVNLSQTFKVKNSPPYIMNDAAVFGLLFMILLIIFKTTKMSRFKGFYKYVPALLLCYFIPAGLNSVGIISSHESGLYFIASRYLLPASLVLLCLSIDMKAIRGLGSKALTMFFAATVGIILGGPLALWLVSLIAPGVLDDEIWRGLSTVAGSWIGGGANQTAMKEIYHSSDQLFSAMIVVDVFVANLFMSVLLFGTGYNKRLNKFFKADDSAIENLKEKMETFQKKSARIPDFYDLLKLLGITFFFVGASHFLADIFAPLISDGLDVLAVNWPYTANLMASFGNGFFWLVVFATIFGISLSFTKYRSLEGVGASKMGSLFLYILVATIGMKMDIMELIANWGVFKFLISIGLIWMLVHAIILFIVAKLIKAPFFYVAVGSQANVGGAASAPIVAGAFSPALAPVGVLLAVLGYAVGTFGAIACTLLMKALTM
ncbi:MAG: putative membrane protein [Arenicella sp.]|jgi:uncharacterized membrane protein